VNPIVDTIMIVLFVLFMIFIIRGYHLSKYHEREADEGNKKEEDKS
jgi:hypothetical protein